MKEQEVKNIITALQQGKDNAFKSIISYYRLDCIRFLMKENTLTREEAEEITSDALFAVFKKLKSGTFEYKGENSIKNYLFTICKNKFIDAYPKKKRDERLLEKAKPEDWQDNQHINSLSDKELMDLAIEMALKLLEGRNCEDIIRLKYHKKLNFIQIAKLLDYASNKVVSEKYKKRCEPELILKTLEIYEQLRNDQIL